MFSRKKPGGTRAGQRPQQGESSGKELKWRVGEEEEEARDKNQVRIWQPDAERQG